MPKKERKKEIRPNGPAQQEIIPGKPMTPGMNKNEESPGSPRHPP